MEKTKRPLSSGKKLLILLILLALVVGAIYLGYENTEFSLNNEANETNAVIQKTGLFLYEDGTSGTIQQMDLAV